MQDRNRVSPFICRHNSLGFSAFHPYLHGGQPDQNAELEKVTYVNRCCDSDNRRMKGNSDDHQNAELARSLCFFKGHFLTP